MIKKITSQIITVIGIFLLLLMCAGISNAETVDELKNKINNANKNLEQLEKEIQKYNNQLKEISNQAVNLQNTIKSLDLSTNKITSEVRVVENNIDKTSYTIRDTNYAITDKEKRISLGKKAINKALNQINEMDNLSVLEMILSNQELSEFWNDVEDIIQVQNQIGDQVNTVKDIKRNLELAKAELEKKKKELEKYNAELSERKEVLQTTKKEKNNLLISTKNTEANYQKILKDKLAMKEILDREINDYESKLKMIIDPKSYPKAGKGILSWPLDDIYITQYFGKTSDSVRLYSSGTHNGIDFRAPIGTKIKSAGNGVVEGVGNTDTICPGASFGKWVFIRYDNGLASTYGHLSTITAKAGQRVKTGEVIGYSGNTGYSTGPHLHMSVYAGQGVKISTIKSSVCRGTYTIPLADMRAYLDPMVYL